MKNQKLTKLLIAVIAFGATIAIGWSCNSDASAVNEDPRVETVADSTANTSQSQHLLFHETN